VAERFRTGPSDARVTRFQFVEIGGPLRLDARQRQLVAQDFGQFFKADFDLEQVLTRLIARTPLFFAVAGHDLVSLFAISLANATGAVLTVAKVGEIELRDGNADEIAAFTADHFAVGDILPQILANFPTHNLPKAGLVSLNALHHGFTLILCVVS
jgi:hypothetical protein